MSAHSFTGEINISAPRARVWELLLNADSFAQWSSVFEGGVTPAAEAGWEEGGVVRFSNADGDGVIAEITRMRDGEVVEWKYIGVLAAGNESRDDNEGWLGLSESFSLADADGGVNFFVRSEHPESYREYFADKWPQAMQKLKTLAENRDGN